MAQYVGLVLKGKRPVTKLYSEKNLNTAISKLKVYSTLVRILNDIIAAKRIQK